MIKKAVIAAFEAEMLYLASNIKEARDCEMYHLLRDYEAQMFGVRQLMKRLIPGSPEVERIVEKAKEIYTQRDERTLLDQVPGRVDVACVCGDSDCQTCFPKGRAIIL